MKFTKLLKAVFISGGITTSTICFVIPSALHGGQCHAEAASIQECISSGQQSWYSWFQGKSRSTQFHFIDLLELLSRLSPTQKS
tara:strand:- start:2904 stop:3155 length:252 start_codon:yes stop_codon:yes gene_type:complete